MPVDKFSISLPEELVAEVDELAQVDGLTRSAVIREATASYLTHRKRAEQKTKHEARVDSAIEGFRRIAAGWGDDERSAADLLREIRGGSEASGD